MCHEDGIDVIRGVYRRSWLRVPRPRRASLDRPAALCFRTWLAAGDPVEERAIVLEEIVEAPVADAWKAWTTVEGLRTFLAPDARVDVRPGGRWEIVFLPDAPPGAQGSEGCKVLEVAERRRLVFEWNFPPGMPIRDEKTRVTVEFHAFGPGTCHVAFRQDGWKDGPDWDAGFAYFSDAWRVVMERFERSFRERPSGVTKA